MPIVIIISDAALLAIIALLVAGYLVLALRAFRRRTPRESGERPIPERHGLRSIK